MASENGVLDVEVVAADRFIWSGEASLVKTKTIDGDIGVMAGHTPVLAVLAAGEIAISPSAGDRIELDVDGGFLSVDHNHVVIAADGANVRSGTTTAGNR